jgi:hypothetical protein
MVACAIGIRELPSGSGPFPHVKRGLQTPLRSAFESWYPLQGKNTKTDHPAVKQTCYTNACEKESICFRY